MVNCIYLPFYLYVEQLGFEQLNTELRKLDDEVDMRSCDLYIYIYIQGLSKRFEHLLLWPPRSPDLTPCDFLLWGYVKDNAYKPPLPQNVRELQDRIRAAVQTIDGNMLKRVWQERLSY